MLTAIGVASIDELFREVPEGVRFHGELELEPALGAGGRRATSRELAGRNVHTAKSSRSSAPASTTTTSPRSSTRCCSAASS